MKKNKMQEIEGILENLRKKLKKAVEKNKAEGLLFSGGLDSAILAFLSPQIKLFTVTFEFWGDDLKYARNIAQFLNLELCHRSITEKEAIDVIPVVIKALKSFDPAIPNDITIYFGLEFARKMGLKKIMTGDGSDELFVGYSYMQSIGRLDEYIKKISQNLQFSSNILGSFLGVEIKQPYLEKEFVDFALKIPSCLKLKKVDGKMTGKWILRKAFEGFLPDEVIWQDKRPLEEGSGTTKLREILTCAVSDEDWKEAKSKKQVMFLNKEHFYYYKIYEREIGRIPEPLPGEKICPGCGAGLKKGEWHCRVCGWTEKIQEI